MAGAQSSEGKSLDRFIGLGKDFVALLRDAALLGLAGLLLLFPTKLNDVLVSAGFEEGSIVGFKWKANLLLADEALKSAQETIASLQAQLDKTTKALGEAHARTHERSDRPGIHPKARGRELALQGGL
jgi:hypothetical protein